MKSRIPSDYINDVSKYNHNFDAGEFGSVHCGLAVPVKSRHLRIGERVRGKIETLVQTQPFQGPLMQGFDIITIATFTPDSVIHGWQNNGRNFTPEQMLEFDSWLFSAVGDISSNVTDGLGVMTDSKLCALGYFNHTDNTLVPPQERKNAWPYTKIGNNSDGKPFLSAVGRGSLWDWLGVPAGATPPTMISNYSNSIAPDYSALPEFMWPVSPVVAYILSCIYYFRNMQEKYMYYTCGLENMDDSNSMSFADVFMRLTPNEILSEFEQMHYSSRAGVVDNATHLRPLETITGWQSMPNSDLQGVCLAGLSTYGGLFAVPYNPDLFNNIIQLGDSPVATIPVVQTENGDFVAVPDMRSGEREQAMLDRLFASGGRWDDVRKALFGKKGNTATNKPDFLGIWRSSINPTNTVATSAGQSENQDVDLAQMGARIDAYSNYGDQEYLDYFAEENGTLMFISVIMPKPAYSQGLNPDFLVKSWADDFNPEMNGEGFQSVPRCRYSMLPNGEDFFNVNNTSAGAINPNNVSVGDEVAWSWLKTDFSRLHGEFSAIGFYQYWTLHRDYSRFRINDDSTKEFFPDTITTYINPQDYQYLFTGVGFEYANFNLFANVDLTCTNAVADNYMPFLGH